MQELSELGFIEDRQAPNSVAAEFLAATGLELPQAFVAFLAFTPPTRSMIFEFDCDGRTEEGTVSEFSFRGSVTASDLISQVVSPDSKRSFLPIGCDAGGNYTYIELSAEGQPVVDIDYSSGSISRVANSFHDFIRILRLDPDY